MTSLRGRAAVRFSCALLRALSGFWEKVGCGIRNSRYFFSFLDEPRQCVKVLPRLEAVCNGNSHTNPASLKEILRNLTNWCLKPRTPFICAPASCPMNPISLKEVQALRRAAAGLLEIKINKLGRPDPAKVNSSNLETNRRTLTDEPRFPNRWVFKPSKMTAS